MRVVQHITFGPDAIEITYMDESDVRLGGKAYLVHNLSVAREAYAEELQALEEQVAILLTDVLGDWARSVPIDLDRIIRRDDDDDEDDGDEDENA